MGKKHDDILESSDFDSSDDEYMPKLYKEQINTNDEAFLFALTLHLGHKSNNYAEYVGVILSQLFHVLFGLTTGRIKSDS